LTENPSKAAQLCWALKSFSVRPTGFSSCGQKIRPIASAASSTLAVETRAKSASRVLTKVPAFIATTAQLLEV
jgi:hypothetical protein